MSTGITSWTGDISKIDAIYPFVGSETVLVILLVIFWLGWHLWQPCIERKEAQEVLNTKK